jgi:hypothetical protein
MDVDDNDAEGIYPSDPEQKHPTAGPSNHRDAYRDIDDDEPTDTEMDEDVDDNLPQEANHDEEFVDDM